MPHKRLFIPGPTEVRPENLSVLARPQVGHRSQEFMALYKRVVPKVQRLLYSGETVFLFTSSSTGVWEAAIRNCVKERVLCCMQGAFSDRWFKVAEANGKRADKLQVEWGRAIHADAVDRALSSGKYDAIAVVHIDHPGTLVAAIHENPLVVGVSPTGVVVLASDVTPLLEFTKDFTFLEDGDLVVLEEGELGGVGEASPGGQEDSEHDGQDPQQPRDPVVARDRVHLGLRLLLDDLPHARLVERCWAGVDLG